MKISYYKFKKIFFNIRYTPIHPQWLAYKHDLQKFTLINKWARGLVVDIGCSDKHISKYLSSNTEYIGLDYYTTASQWYQTRPHIYGDAQDLPFSSESMDTLLLLDVLEHLPSPDSCFKEIKRVLKPSGLLIIQVPFLYPLHDTPLDFHRWSIYGLRCLAKKYELEIIEEAYLGNPLETAGLLSNIAICKLFINWFKQKNPMLLFTPLVPLVVITINLASRFISALTIKDTFMPHGYRLILKRGL